MATDIFPRDAAPQLVERRLFRFPGCDTWVYRWFIVSDAVPKAYRSEAEALAALAARHDRRAS